MSAERRIHNGVVIDEIPGVQTEAQPAAVQPPLHRQAPPSAEDIEPESLAAAMAGVISAALDEDPAPVPMDIVNRLLGLRTARGHKVVWTRFDIHQLFALWTNKQDRD